MMEQELGEDCYGEKESLKQIELTLLHAGWSHVNAEGSFKRSSLGRHSKRLLKVCFCG